MIPISPAKLDRIVGQTYLYKNEQRIWAGTRWNCIHGRKKSDCRECKGGSVCVHNKLRTRCRECDGGSFCEHNKIRSQCKECNGANICEHNKRRSTCIECDGSEICEHKERKSRCVECGGSEICGHGKHKYACKECQGSGFCKHGKQNYYCKECGGAGICAHGNNKQICKECLGSRICEHDLQKTQCRTCDYPKHPEKWCKLCTYVQLTARSRFKPYCFHCHCVTFPDSEVPRKYKLKEHHLRDVLKEEFKKVDLVFDKKVDGGCSLRRPDIRIECLTHTIIIECDEEQHKNYSCENKRIMELFQDLGNRPLIIIRFNPDSYKIEKGSIEGCFNLTKTGSLSLNKKEWKKRVKCVIDTIRKHISIIPIKELTVELLFYDS